MTRLMTIPLVFLAFVACSYEEEPLVCTDLAAVSVSVTVKNAAGEALEAAVVTFDAGAGPVACDSFQSGEYLCGFEVQGDLTIRVSADGFDDHEETVTVGFDGCHVVQEFLAVVLEPADVDCTDVEVAAVRATVAGAGGEALENVRVEWGDPRADMAPQPCDLQDDGSWTCAPERTGEVEVYASASGHQTDIEIVTVSLDEAGCHPITEDVAFALQWLPD